MHHLLSLHSLTVMLDLMTLFPLLGFYSLPARFPPPYNMRFLLSLHNLTHLTHLTHLPAMLYLTYLEYSAFGEG
jgi:hypothetical protein|tara:strand:+ start:333 stop:554 length:222 start_codon:yes stop_codon:yes gene_type:complete